MGLGVQGHMEMGGIEAGPHRDGVVADGGVQRHMGRREA